MKWDAFNFQTYGKLECTTEIKVGERKIIEFFMEPIVEHFDGSLEVR